MANCFRVMSVGFVVIVATTWLWPIARSAWSEEKKVEKLPDIGVIVPLVTSLDKVPVQEQSWGWLRWLVNDELSPGSPLTVGVVQIHAGQKNPPHKHPNCDEVIYVLSGSCEHRVGDKMVVLHPGDSLRIPRGVPHGAKVIGSEPMKSIVVYDTGKREFVPVPE
jgi:quercetin dioxygenase-like cupin family protein